MMDSIIRARDKFLNKKTGLMFPSHCSMFLAPVRDEDERKQNNNEYAGAMADWHDFAETTKNIYGVDMSVLETSFDREQKEYYLLSSRWMELRAEVVLAEPKMIKHFNMAACTLEDARGIAAEDVDANFCFDINGDENIGPVSALAGWFTADFRSRTDSVAENAPKIHNPSFLSTGPENGYTHWGQQVFYLLSSLPLLKGEVTRLEGSIEMMRTKENARLYNCRFKLQNSRRKVGSDENGPILMKSAISEHVYQMP
jgi:protein arginine N-methyltransferase 1